MFKLPHFSNVEFKSGLAVPAFNCPILIIFMELGGFQIQTLGGEFLNSVDSSAIFRAIGDCDQLARWMISRNFNRIYCYFICRKIIIIMLAGEKFSKLCVWDLPPIQKIDSKALQISRDSDLFAYGIRLSDASTSDCLEGCFICTYIGQWIKIKFNLNPKAQVPVLTSQLPTIAKFNPSLGEESETCGSSNLCGLCRIIPGTIIMSWENYMALPEDESETNKFGFALDWNVDGEALDALENYEKHGWHICIVHEQYTGEILGTQTPEKIIDEMLTSLGSHCIDGISVRRKMFSTNTINVLLECLYNYDGKPIIVYDLRQEVLREACLHAAKNDAEIIAVGSTISSECIGLRLNKKTVYPREF